MLGLDTGGTNTDAVLYDPEKNRVILSAKDFTTHRDLSIGIRGAIAKLLDLTEDRRDEIAARIKSVNISTTLATNAIAEGQSRKVGLVMIGFDETQDIVLDMVQRLPACFPIFVGGGHDYYGREVRPLDEAKLLEGIRKAKSEVSAWAISGFFSIKNPLHEMRAATLIERETKGLDQPVTLGQNLTGELGAARRAATAALNAGLVVIIEKLLEAVKQSLSGLGLEVPLMVVKGDGDLASELWARERPIETVVSGPAAGLLGAKILAKGFLEPSEKDLWILDVGGTTSDLAYLRDGRPKTNVNGAVVGHWTTMVEAVDTTTRGLGGDSLVDFDDERNILLGPRRVLPLCRLAEKHPKIIEDMSPGARHKLVDTILCRFFVPNLPPDSGLNDYEKEIIELLEAKNPLTFFDYHDDCLFRGHLFPGLKFLSHPSILVSAFTPTDALSVLGLFKEGVPEASLKAAQLLGMTRQMSPEEFSRAVMHKFGELLTMQIVDRALTEDGVPHSPKDFSEKGLLGRAIANRRGALNVNFSLDAPVILLGAPAGVLVPWLQKYLRARILAPPRYEVASATGAAASMVSLTRRVDIVSLPDFKTYRAFLPDRLLDGHSLNALVQDASAIMARHMTNLARLAGAGDDCPIRVTRDDRTVLTGDGVWLPMGTVLRFTAGRERGERLFPSG
ncbi:MAG: hydantoinase/oxoprolinase family protein [Deltaproteobacteria bacterium]|nr:hydantoinase/oxoprolinase family protein [Deltaproteobacteria bacterium]